MIITKADLIKISFTKSTAQGIIREARALMIQKGFSFYNNKRLGNVPKEAIEEITGLKL